MGLVCGGLGHRCAMPPATLMRALRTGMLLPRQTGQDALDERGSSAWHTENKNGLCVVVAAAATSHKLRAVVGATLVHAIDIALLPIGAYSPRWFLKTRHMNPPEAIRAFKDLNATQMIPCHFGCFQLSLEKLNAPFPWFTTAAENEEVDWQLPIGFSSNSLFSIDSICN